MKERRAVAFTGPSGSGKTTLIEKLAYYWKDTKRVAIIKHDPKDKAKFDTPGKDSERFFRAGAETAVVSPTRTTFFSHRSRDLSELVEMFGMFDILMVEGLKTWPLPRICIFRGKIDRDYLDVCDAVAIDESIDVARADLPKRLAVLDLNDISSVAAWIEAHAATI